MGDIQDPNYRFRKTRETTSQRENNKCCSPHEKKSDPSRIDGGKWYRVVLSLSAPPKNNLGLHIGQGKSEGAAFIPY